MPRVAGIAGNESAAKKIDRFAGLIHNSRGNSITNHDLEAGLFKALTAGCGSRAFTRLALAARKLCTAGCGCGLKRPVADQHSLVFNHEHNSDGCRL